MPVLSILVLQDVSLVGRFQDFTPANQRNNNVVEASNFAVATFII
jgi:hypothetical protein